MNGEESAIGGDTQLRSAFLTSRPSHYRVIWNSTFSEACQACGRPPATYPLRGSVELQYGSAYRWDTVDLLQHPDRDGQCRPSSLPHYGVRHLVGLWPVLFSPLLYDPDP